MIRAVIDTNVVVSAFLWAGVPRELLQLAREGKVQLFASAPLIEELAEVLARSKSHSKVAASGLSVDELVDHYREMASLVAPASARGSAPDPDDDMVIGTAIAAHADLLVTGNRALLELGDLATCRIVSVSGAIRLITEAEALYPPAPGM